MFITITDAYPKDIASLLKIETRCFKAGDCFNYNQFYYLIKKSKGVFKKITFLHDIIIGYFYLNTSHEKYLRLYSLAIDLIYQKKGLGSYIVNYLECKCIELKRECIRLEVRKDNKKARRFYTRNGFEAYDIKKGYYPDGTDAILMQKDFKCLRIDGKT
jgi:ribosomal-protein-alanine N-acetyltransferase